MLYDILYELNNSDFKIECYESYVYNQTLKLV